MQGKLLFFKDFGSQSLIMHWFAKKRKEIQCWPEEYFQWLSYGKPRTLRKS